jgi:hypothetical protein
MSTGLTGPLMTGVGLLLGKIVSRKTMDVNVKEVYLWMLMKWSNYPYPVRYRENAQWYVDFMTGKMKNYELRKEEK